MSMFSGFQISLFVEDIEPCVSFSKAIGFEETYRTPAEGPPEHVEVRALGLTLGIASVNGARDVHGLNVSAAGNAMEVFLWRDDAARPSRGCCRPARVPSVIRTTFKAGVSAPDGCSTRPTTSWRSCSADDDG